MMIANRSAINAAINAAIIEYCCYEHGTADTFDNCIGNTYNRFDDRHVHLLAVGFRQYVLYIYIYHYVFIEIAPVCREEHVDK